MAPEDKTDPPTSKSPPGAQLVQIRVARPGFVVFCSDDKKLEDRLKRRPPRSGSSAALTIEPPAGPDDYKIAKDAEVTVIYYVDKTVKVNRAFRKGELNAKAIDALVADLAKILPDAKPKKDG